MASSSDWIAMLQAEGADACQSVVIFNVCHLERHMVVSLRRQRITLHGSNPNATDVKEALFGERKRVFPAVIDLFGIQNGGQQPFHLVEIFHDESHVAEALDHVDSSPPLVGASSKRMSAA